MKVHQLPITIVIPVLNEEQTIDSLLQSLEQQTAQPSEILFVDGGSIDSTLSIIKEYKKIRVHQLPKSNRSQARNYGIKKASSEIIIVTDAGCIPKNDWLEKITAPLLIEYADVVAGFYDTNPQNQFEEIVSNVTSVRPWNFDEKTFLPSSRSLAFTKKVWKEVKGYPEELNTCEDLVFAERLKKSAKKWVVKKEAQVIWKQPKTLTSLMEKVTNYALGDLEAEYERHTKKIRSAMWRIGILLGLGLPLLFVPFSMIKFFGIGLFVLYIIGCWMKHRIVIKSITYFVYAPLIQFAVDVALFQAWLEYQFARASKSPFSH